ncbi:hypothetical protein [Streptomyces acidiscabies]|uniref:Uncharacterized protein n=1 Tax=Streptomyces acidiscabies TaxID=42234 RepID=A0AAP6BME3_9ACTN|nr:hypothetical protein [Streptomyces acidiscabies]MDX2967381.1 hypothetical protein [Streptomyces acidiscabies]MDX3792198.1 hypothetical protein [Streptomyces acidiscabies]
MRLAQMLNSHLISSLGQVSGMLSPVSTDSNDHPLNGSNGTAHSVGADLPRTIATLDEVEAYRVLVTGANWATLGHAYGPAAEAPRRLAELLAQEQSVRTKALNYLHHTLHHQNTLYEATVPAALCVASILPNPRTTRTVANSHYSSPLCMRAELLLWIASVADAVTDEADAFSRRQGFPLDDYPPAVGIRTIRPSLHSAAVAYVDDANRQVAEAAITACIPLLDDPRLLHHRTSLIPAIRQILGTSERWQHREQAIDALDTWGEDSTGLEGQRNPFLFCDNDAPTRSSTWSTDTSEGYSEPPPF